MANFQQVNLSDIQQVLKAEKGWKQIELPAFKGKPIDEYVFACPVKYFPNAIFVVYTSIDLVTGEGRPVGADAIRVNVFNAISLRPIIRKQRRVHRVAGWAENLKARVTELLNEFNQRKFRADQQCKASGYDPSAPEPAPEAAPQNGQEGPSQAFSGADLVAVDPKGVQYPAFVTKAARLAWVREVLANNQGWALWALGAIFARQTEQEQSADVTTEDNGIGFSGIDAELLSSFAKQFEQRGWLSAKQLPYLYKRISKYAGQVVDILESLQLAPVVKVKKAA